MSARSAHSFAVVPFAVAAACAALDQPERAPPPPSDGIAPYRQVQRIEVCKATARLVAAAPDNGEQGVCGPSGRAARSCSTHADCGARQACLCGRCTAALCRFNRDCPAGLVCAGQRPERCARRCETDVDCPRGSLCEELVCTPACSSSDDCEEGELCIAGRCNVRACGPNGPACGSGETCDLQLEEGRLLAPGVLLRGGITVLYAELERIGGTGILRAESRDGLRFEAAPTEPVVAPTNGQVRVGAPSPIVAPEGIVLFYDIDDGAGIARAVGGADGTVFSAAQIALSPLAAWEQGAVRAPGALRLGADEALFYEGGAGIGLAVSRAGGDFERVSATSLLDASRVENPAHWTAIERVGAPFALVATDALGERSLRLFFSALGREDTAPHAEDGGPPLLNFSIGLAAAPLGSLDALELLLYADNPVLGGLQPNRVPVVEHAPSVVRAGDEWRMYFEGDGGIWLATNPPR
jgi:hypothetical protein